MKIEDMAEEYANKIDKRYAPFKGVPAEIRLCDVKQAYIDGAKAVFKMLRELKKEVCV